MFHYLFFISLKQKLKLKYESMSKPFLFAALITTDQKYPAYESLKSAVT